MRDEKVLTSNVHRVVVSGDHIEVQFNLNANSRVVTYSADLYKKEIPQPSRQEVFEVFAFAPTKMLATHGAGDGNRTHAASLEGWNSTIELHPQILRS